MSSLELYEKLVKTIPEVERKGATNPYTSVNGHMFSHLIPSGTFAIRLPKEELEKFLVKFKTTLFESYGVVKKDWAVVPDSLLNDTRTLQKYFRLSYEYVKTLKPKPSGKRA
jgi:hypothetical protein